MRIIIWSWLVFFGMSQAVQAVTNTLPVDLALPLDSAGERGFLVRTVQAYEILPNSLRRAVEQLNGTLTGQDGLPVIDVAIPGTNWIGGYDADTINFELNATEIFIWDNVLGAKKVFYPAPFPGAATADQYFNYFAMEIVAFLELPPGRQVFGLCVSAARTDITDDDDYQLSIGINPRDFFAQPLARFEKTIWVDSSATPVENLVTVEVPVAGIYPFRLLYWQTAWGANLQWYVLNPDTHERILINDPADARAIKSYRSVTQPRTLGPYVSEVMPWPDTGGNTPAAPIEAVLFDGQTAVDDSSLRFYLNDTLISQTNLIRDNHRVTMFGSPPSDTAPGLQHIRLEYASRDGLWFTNEWTFTTGVTPDTRTTGQWDFDRGDLSATVGLPLEYLDGPNGLTAQETRFGTTADFGLPPINGQVAKVMQVPANLDRRIGYLMCHGILPNGGGSRVNQYTIIFDILVATNGAWAAALLQISSTNNLDDGDLFWQNYNFGQGFGGYYGNGIFSPGEWHRVVAAYNLAASPPVVTKYVDGMFQWDWTENVSLDHPRRALLPWAILFADGDQDERRLMWINSVQIREGALAKADIEALGGPCARGIPMGNGIPNLALTIRPSANQANAQFDLAFNTVYAEPPKKFILERTPSLNPPAWVPQLTTNATTDTVIYTDTASNPAGFWRVRME